MNVKPPALASQISSTELEEALRGLRSGGYSNHGRVTVLDNGVQVADTFYNAQDLLLIDGSVSSDRLAETRSTANLRLEVLSVDGADFVDPLQNFEFVPQVGVETDDYIVWLPCGHYFSRDIDEGAGLGRTSVGISLVDWSTRYRENPWKEVFALDDGITYAAAIQAVVGDRANGWTPMVLGTLGTDVTPAGITYSADDDPWAAAWKLAQTAGGEVYHNREGVLVIQKIATSTEIAPHSEIFGDEYQTVDQEVRRKLSRGEVFNGVICRGNAPWLLFPISGEVWDEDPASITWRGGRFGERPKIIEDGLVTSPAQCLAMAQAEYARVAGIRYTLDASSLKDPTLEVGHFVRCLLPDLEGTYVVDTLSMGLLTMNMSLSMRKKI